MGYLEAHLKKYPLMQIEDKIKLLMQATLGPAHLINDKEQVRKRIYDEYEGIKDLDYDAESEIAEFTKELSQTYFALFNVANKYLAMSKVLTQKVNSVLEDAFELDEFFPPHPTNKTEEINTINNKANFFIIILLYQYII